MKRLAMILVLVALAGPPALAQRTVYISPDVPTDDPGGSGTVFLPWDVVAYKGGIYTPLPVLSFPAPTALDALHKMDRPGHWLFSVEAPAELPPGGGVWFEPEDVGVFDGSNFTVVFDGSVQGVPAGVNVDAIFFDRSDFGDLILSFDVPTTIGAATYDSADLVRFSGGVYALFFDASASGAGVATSDNVTGADESLGNPVLTLDVPSDLVPSSGPTTYLPGQIADWDGATYNPFEILGGWPLTSEVDALSCQANPGRVYERVVYPFLIDLSKPSPFVGNITISWTQSCSSGAEDYGIYEGTLGNWTSHKGKVCTDTGGDLTETITPQTADSFYLVVPHNYVEEGAFGKDHVPTRVPPRIERLPPALPADRCVPAYVATPCP